MRAESCHRGCSESSGIHVADPWGSCKHLLLAAQEHAHVCEGESAVASVDSISTVCFNEVRQVIQGGDSTVVGCRIALIGEVCIVPATKEHWVVVSHRLHAVDERDALAREKLLDPVNFASLLHAMRSVGRLKKSFKALLCTEYKGNAVRMAPTFLWNGSAVIILVTDPPDAVDDVLCVLGDERAPFAGFFPPFRFGGWACLPKLNILIRVYVLGQQAALFAEPVRRGWVLGARQCPDFSNCSNFRIPGIRFLCANPARVELSAS